MVIANFIFFTFSTVVKCGYRLVLSLCVFVGYKADTTLQVKHSESLFLPFIHDRFSAIFPLTSSNLLIFTFEEIIFEFKIGSLTKQFN